MTGRWASLVLGVLLAACPVPVTIGRQLGPAPHLLYTDVVSGPTSGGEDNAGAYLALFGRHFGDDLGAIDVFIGGVSVAKKLSLGASKGRADVQQLTVQVGALGGATGSLPIELRVAGQASNVDQTFLVQPGDTLFVDNVNGDDTTAVKNDVTRPFRALQTPSGGGALGQARAGDVVVLRGHATWSAVGLDNRWAHLGAIGSAPTGRVGTGPLTLRAYPGEEVHFIPQVGTRGGLHGATTTPAATWVVITGLRVEGGDASVTDGPIVLQVGSDHWRVVNNDVGPWAAPASAKAGGITGDGASIALLGNHVHDFAGGETNCIGLDDGTVDAEVAWNWLTACRAGSGVQTFMSQTSRPLERIAIHHNVIRDTARAGVLLGDGTLSARVWNNDIADTDSAGVRVNHSGGTVSLVVEHNSIAQPCRQSASPSAAVLNTAAATTGDVRFANNLFVNGAASTCTAGYQTTDADTAVHFERNAWAGFNAPSGDSFALTAAPLLVDQAGGDLHLTAQSPLIDASRGSTVVDDADGDARRGIPDVGAYEFVAPAPSAPVELSMGCAAMPGALASWLVVITWALVDRRGRAPASRPRPRGRAWSRLHRGTAPTRSSTRSPG